MELADGPVADSAGKHPWNWKVLFENNNDAYHANRLHKGLHDVVPSGLCRFPELPEDTAAYFRYNGMPHKDGAINPLQKAILRIFPELTDAQRHEVIYANIPPTLTFGFRVDQIGYAILHAESAEETSFEAGVLYAPGAMDEPLFAERRAINSQTSASISAQDRHVDTNVQRGLRSRYANRGRYSWQEQTHRDFNRWLVQRYRRTWEGNAFRVRASAAE
jgi:phenylpropionate dioxygenase-like ring-hydroxylating dioxygenase large terminal subunit